MTQILKHLALCLALLLLLGVLSGCGAPTAPEAPPENETIVFTDSLGREVTLPAGLERIAPSGTLAQVTLYTLSPEKMVGWCTNPTGDMKRYFDPRYTNLPTFGTFYGKNADLNMEALIAARPQVVIDMGEIKGSAQDMTADLDGLQTQLNIPVVFIESTLETSGNAYRMLGDLLAMPEQAKELADYCDAAVAEAKANAAALQESRKLRVYYGGGDNGLQTSPAGSFHCEVLELVGAVNVADIPVISGAGGNQISMEQLLQWAPDVMIFGPESVYETVGADPLWRDLSAVGQKRVYEIPSGPYNWIDRPPAVNRILGIKWLGNLLYPELFDYDMCAVTREFYSLFYHYDLTDTEAAALLQNSTAPA